MIDLLTYATNAILLVTLVYCILLERRIRAFRQQETVFRGLIAEVTRATVSAQTAVSQLRAALNDADRLDVNQLRGNNLRADHGGVDQWNADKMTARSRHEPLVAPTRENGPHPKNANGRAELSDLARRVAEMRLAGAQAR